MSPRLHTHCGETIQRALSRGAGSLDESARETVAAFVLGQWNEEGGFRGRSTESDLYYTVFGLECARAVEVKLPYDRMKGFVEAKARGPLDFVHLTCLARCLELLWPGHEKPAWGASIKDRLRQHVCAEGGFHRKTGRRKGSVYESFLGMLAVEALGETFPDPIQMGACLGGLCQASGGFINGDGLLAPTTPVTAAALLLLLELQHPLPLQSTEWLLKRQCSRGGFSAATLVPLADLLSTATALHVLQCVGGIPSVKLAACFDFVNSCWSDSGGFHAHSLDRTADCEYTFYALLALGNLVAEPKP